MMAYRTFTRYFKYKSLRFHVWFNQKADIYCHKETEIEIHMEPYEGKAARRIVLRIQKKANDHWSHFLVDILVGFILFINAIIAYIIIC